MENGGQVRPEAGISVDQDAVLAVTIAINLKRNAEIALKTRCMLLRVNDDADLRRLFDNTAEAQGLNTIYYSLLDQLILTTLRMHDHYQPKTNKQREAGKDRASLPRLFHLIYDDEIADNIDGRRALHQAQDAYTSLVKSERGSTWLKTLRQHRDFIIAHSLFERDDREKALFGYMGDLLDATLPIVADIQLGTRGLNWYPQEIADKAKEMADAFWTVVHAGMGSRRVPPDLGKQR